MARREYPIISLFSGALGLDLGLEEAGFRLRVAVECNRFAAETIRTNRPDVNLFERRVEDVSTQELLMAAGLRRGEAAVVTAGPSCQAFSTAGKRGSISDPRGAMFHQFIRVVREAQPRFFVMENVRGVLSAAVRHRPLAKRGPGHSPLEPDEQLGSALLQILRALRSTGYHVVFDVLNAADFGVPQTRERVVFIGSRDGEPIESPRRTHSEDKSGGRPRWVTLRKAIAKMDERKATFSALSPGKQRVLRRIEEGGNWRDLPRGLQGKALGRAFVSWGGRSGFFRRLAWDKPAPALTSRPDSKATMLIHPTELRPLSVQEYAVIQQFPPNWRLAGGIPQQYLQLGNAVPTGLGRAIGLALRTAMRKRSRVPLRCKVVCADPALLKRLAERPVTVLNPKRMRRVKGLKAARRWMHGQTRSEILRHVTVAKAGIPAPQRGRRARAG